MSGEKVLLPCYNRGCGQKFDPSDNKDGDCSHHPGVPVFHDAYKGWSCCKKKCTDFTEFLNIKGCTSGSHSNEKPPEPEKPPVDNSVAEKVKEVKPLAFSTMERPPFDSPRVTLEPVVSTNLLEQIKGLTSPLVKKSDETKVEIGQSCYNKSCKATYRALDSLTEVCIHHPGVPIFHEGLKYWSCCQKKTTDFSVFLAQPGCTEGIHEWTPKSTDKKINCRMDWHQTGPFVVVSIFAKKYQPNESSVKLSPVRLTVDLFFVEEDSRYNLDVELRGIVDVDKSSVSMLPTKVEIKLKKAESGNWSQLTFPRSCNNETVTPEIKSNDQISDRVEAVDLSDL